MYNVYIIKFDKTKGRKVGDSLGKQQAERRFKTAMMRCNDEWYVDFTEVGSEEDKMYEAIIEIV